MFGNRIPLPISVLNDGLFKIVVDLASGELGVDGLPAAIRSVLNSEDVQDLILNKKLCAWYQIDGECYG